MFVLYIVWLANDYILRPFNCALKGSLDRWNIFRVVPLFSQAIGCAYRTAIWQPVGCLPWSAFRCSQLSKIHQSLERSQQFLQTKMEVTQTSSSSDFIQFSKTVHHLTSLISPTNGPGNARSRPDRWHVPFVVDLHAFAKLSGAGASRRHQDHERAAQGSEGQLVSHLPGEQRRWGNSLFVYLFYIFISIFWFICRYICRHYFLKEKIIQKQTCHQKNILYPKISMFFVQDFWNVFSAGHHRGDLRGM